jgi:group I intron endonuclease
MFIYKITNQLNGKVYVGKTEFSIESRWKKHLQCATKKVNRYLYDAINKYGSVNFLITQIEKCNNKDDLNYKEKLWIKEYRSTDKNFGYNMQEGGTGGAQPKEIIEKIRSKRIGFKHSEKTKKKMSECKKGKFNHYQSDETKNKLSIIVKDLWQDGVLNSNNNAMRGKSGELHHFFGKHHTKEAKKIISEKGKGRVGSDKQKQVVREKWLGNKNPNYINIPKDKLGELLKELKQTQEISIYFNVSAATIISKTKQYFDYTPTKYKENLCKK